MPSLPELELAVWELAAWGLAAREPAARGLAAALLAVAGASCVLADHGPAARPEHLVAAPMHLRGGIAPLRCA